MSQWILRTSDFKISPIQGEVTPSTRGQALTAAFKKLGLFWGVAAVSILIPVFHFVLVPLFVIVGALFFFKTLKIQWWVGDLHAKCPACGYDVRLHHAGFRDELRLKCEQCNLPLVLTQSI